MFHEWKLIFMESLCIWSSSKTMFDMRSFDLVTCCKRTAKLSTASCNMSCDLWSIHQQLQLPLAAPEKCVGRCSTHDLWGSLKGNNHRDSCLVNMVARIIHTWSVLKIDLTWSVLKIDLTGHSYQTHHARCPRWHLLYVGMTIFLEECCVHISCSLND